MLVDDEKSIRKSLSLQLNHLGFEVIIASNGEQAIEIFQSQKKQIKVVLLDLVMPVMDGSECFARLRHLDPLVKIVLMSGYSHMDQVKNMIKLGVSGFLQKPFKLSDLSNILSNLIDSPT